MLSSGFFRACGRRARAGHVAGHRPRADARGGAASPSGGFELSGGMVRLRTLVERLHSSLWFLPTVAVTAAVALALGLIALESRLGIDGA